MNPKAFPSFRQWPGALLLGLALILVGCATVPEINWDSRVGAFSYDEAVLELGPPEKLEQLSDGTKVAEWLVSRGHSQGTIYPSGGGFYGGPWVGHYSNAPAPNTYIRLIFGPDGILSSWRKIIK